MAKIGVGIVTCNRLDYLRGLLKSLPTEKIDELVVVNDGLPVNEYVENEFNYGYWIDNPVNLGVGKSKNKAMKHLVSLQCEYIFINILLPIKSLEYIILITDLAHLLIENKI